MTVSFWRRLLFGLILLSLICFNYTPEAAANSIGKVERVVLVIVDRVNVDDYAGPGLTNIKNLAKRGAVGLLNNNTGAGIYPEHTYPTIGGGAHLVGVGEAFNGFNENEKVVDALAADEFIRRTGIKPPPGSVLQLAIGELIRTNKALPYPAVPGELGEALHQAGLKTAIIGNADTVDVHRRLATTITMDSRGLTDMGNVQESILAHEPTALGALRTKFDKVEEEFNLFRKKGAALIVIETGDITRIYEEKDKATDEAYAKQRSKSLAEIDKFVGQLAKQMDFSREMLMVVHPTPTDEAIKENKNLTPIIAVGPGFTPGALLTSGTTKRDGIVMNTDIAPTILKSLGLKAPVQMSGRPFLVSPLKLTEDSLTYLQNLNQKLLVTYKARPPLQSAYVLLQIAVLFVALYGIFFKRHIAEVVKPFLLVVMAVPLAELLLPLIPQNNVAVTAILLIIVTLIIAGLAVVVNRKLGLDPFIFICVATAGVILGDVFNGSYLQKQSLLGYDPIVGARFYGIGNEYMGVLIGSVIVGTTAAIQYWPKWRKTLIVVSGLLYLLTIYAMAAPNLGTNVGGTIAIIAALLVTFLLLMGVRFKLRTVFMVMALVLVALISFIAFDLSRPPDLRSHIGTTASLILSSGPDQALQIIQRKWEMNMKLLRYTVWSRVLLMSIAMLALLFYRPRGVMEKIRIKYPFLFKGFIGVVTGALVAFTFNDSGVVAAATTMIFGAPPLAYLVLSEQTD
ncbi:hypothetical protein Desca_1592 [Desulfotomaculum nigrificans CO-1-SRB]|uniref:Uncharacterized protein n=1 Tax=Desulfotomaculum nigrificans (strain DSM 14880 / VKM B-2319 / CO-1-SRB) TaxID=868595 RepID=F6B720_DESCC|nr:hypothetical protein [Desulfotomaculum nigrificans]AEF94445.1 hypothetical protein Desca_1592 [Desulfotomaculum nigrificans CO-1-SRB]